MSSNELLKKAKAGDADALKMLINRSLAKQGISVRSVENNQGSLSIVLRSMKGDISEKIIDSIREKTEKLSIESINRVSVSQYVPPSNSASKSKDKPKYIKESNLFSHIDQTKIKEKISAFTDGFQQKHYIGLVGAAILMLGLMTYIGRQRVCRTSDNQIAFEEFRKIISEWKDAEKVASSTSRMALPEQINLMQSIKRETENMSWSTCSQGAADLLVQSMEKQIEGFLLFLDSDISDSLVQSKMDESDDLLFSYREEYMKLLPPKEKREEEKDYYQTMAEGSLFMLSTDQTWNYIRNEELETDMDKLLEGEVLSGVEGIYTFEVLESTKEIFVFAANAEKRDLRSYVSGVSGRTYLICESKKESKSISKPVLSDGRFNCADDSSESMRGDL